MCFLMNADQSINVCLNGTCSSRNPFIREWQRTDYIRDRLDGLNKANTRVLFVSQVAKGGDGCLNHIFHRRIPPIVLSWLVPQGAIPEHQTNNTNRPWERNRKGKRRGQREKQSGATLGSFWLWFQDPSDRLCSKKEQ